MGHRAWGCGDEGKVARGWGTQGVQRARLGGGEGAAGVLARLATGSRALQSAGAFNHHVRLARPPTTHTSQCPQSTGPCSNTPCMSLRTRHHAPRQQYPLAHEVAPLHPHGAVLPLLGAAPPPAGAGHLASGAQVEAAACRGGGGVRWTGCPLAAAPRQLLVTPASAAARITALRRPLTAPCTAAGRRPGWASPRGRRRRRPPLPPRPRCRPLTRRPKVACALQHLLYRCVAPQRVVIALQRLSRLAGQLRVGRGRKVGGGRAGWVPGPRSRRRCRPAAGLLPA